ncbi:MAG: CPBP family intramembrane glutamic endopeptidase [Chthoniobacteraceae bacterium]
MPPGPEIVLWLEASLTIALVILAGRAYLGIWQKARLEAKLEETPTPFGLPDVLVCLVLFTWLGEAVARGFAAPPRRLNDFAIIEGGLVFAVVVSGILLLLHARGVPIVRLFGLHPEAPKALLRRALWLFAAALPLVYVSFIIVTTIKGGEPQPQDVTAYFQEAAVALDWYRMGLVLGFAALVAPVTEEFLFRGYFYGVIRRYLGVSPALVLTSALFAAIHLNGGVMLPLFVLAMCLSLTFEATGSVLACMVIHSLFNTTMLALMFYSARHP